METKFLDRLSGTETLSRPIFGKSGSTTINRCAVLTRAALASIASVTFAQCAGPSVTGGESTNAATSNARVGSYHALEGNIASHLREDRSMLREATDEMRVVIFADRFGRQQVNPEDTVRIMSEIDRSLAGRYPWAKSLSLAN